MSIKHISSYLTLLLIFTSVISTAQSKLIAKADKKFNNFDYAVAVRLYKQAAAQGESEYHASVQAATCYRYLQQPALAIEWYEKALKFPGADSKLHLHIAQELKKTNRIPEADEHLNEYYASRYMTTHKQEFNYQTFIKQIDRDSLSSLIETTDINTSKSEFGPIMINNVLYFSSNRPTRGFAQIKDGQTNEAFFALYKTSAFEDGNIVNPKSISSNATQKTNDGSGCYDFNTGTFYLTQNRISGGKNRSTLTINTYLTGSNIKLDRQLGQLPFAHENYSVAHPTISADGKYLFFASDMPEGYGGWDIYKCEIRNGFYSSPVNLGPIINTPGNESFPFIASDGNLYFSSDGHPGKGGIDIFIAINHNDEFITVVNPGKPINTESDDFAITLDKSRRWGFLSSNRKGSIGEDDIFRLKFNKLPDYTIVNGTVFSDNETEFEANVLIKVTDKNGETVTETTTNENGTYQIALKSSESYEISFTKRHAGTQKIFLSQPDLIGQKVVVANIKF